MALRVAEITEMKPPLCPVLCMGNDNDERCVQSECAWFLNGGCVFVYIGLMLGDIAYKIDPARITTYTASPPTDLMWRMSTAAPMTEHRPEDVEAAGRDPDQNR